MKFLGLQIKESKIQTVAHHCMILYLLDTRTGEILDCERVEIKRDIPNTEKNFALQLRIKEFKDKIEGII